MEATGYVIVLAPNFRSTMTIRTFMSSALLVHLRQQRLAVDRFARLTPRWPLQSLEQSSDRSGLPFVAFPTPPWVRPVRSARDARTARLPRR
jgi:hypothetical protein